MLKKLIAGALGLLALGTASPALAVQGTIVSPVTFVGPVTGDTINFSLYLPPGYDTGTTRYPVVYFFHGIGGAHGNAAQNTTIAQNHEDAVAAGRIGPVIVVIPDGDNDSWWADSFDGTRRIETHVVREVLPYVDLNYRTLATRDKRASTGFSMGGFGAAKFAAKFPDLFAAGVVYDGAMVRWSTVLQYHGTAAAAMFGNDEAHFNQYSPWYWVTQNAAVLRTSVPFRVAAGDLVSSNQLFRDHLVANGLAPEYVATGCAHDIGCLFDRAGADSWSLIGRAFGGVSPTPTVTPTRTPTRTATRTPTRTATATATATVTATLPPTQVSFVSIGTEDGWLLESSEASGVGGTAQPAWVGASGLTAGDAAADQQYKAVLSFDTSAIPDDATIVSATLRVTRGTVAGTDPFTTHGACSVDISTGGFGGDAALQSADFEAPATATQVATLTAAAGTSEAALNTAGLAAIDKAGRSQLRIAFATDDNDDLGVDSVSWYPGENATAANRPELIVTYR